MVHSDVTQLFCPLKVDGGCDISLIVSWSQKLSYKDGHFSISIPFNFPEFVTPLAKIIAKREKISLNVSTCNENEVIIEKSSHALKVNASETVF